MGNQRRNMIQHNLYKNVIGAYFAAVEIHNKPNISYRYETVTLLLINAWELLLKAYLRKFTKGRRNIFEKNGHTITLDKSIAYVKEEILPNNKEYNAIFKNLELLEEYRDCAAHYYNQDKDNLLFLIIAKGAFNFIEFVTKYFEKDILTKENLIIMPLGFTTPVNPLDILVKNRKSTETLPNSLARKVIKITEELEQEGVRDSVLLRFDVKLESIKKISNCDILAGITDNDNADISIHKDTKIQISNDPSLPKAFVPDGLKLSKYVYTYKKLCDECREEIPGFKLDKKFHSIKKTLLWINPDLVYERSLDPRDPDAQTRRFYSKKAVQVVKQNYL